MRWMREEVRHQKYRYDPRSPDWVGLALAKHLGLDPRADRKELNAILRAWYANGVLAAEIQRRRCATSGNTWFPEIGTMIPMPPDSTASVAMRERALKTEYRINGSETVMASFRCRAPAWRPFTGA
jgi:hypothetical protein